MIGDRRRVLRPRPLGPQVRRGARIPGSGARRSAVRRSCGSGPSLSQGDGRQLVRRRGWAVWL